MSERLRIALLIDCDNVSHKAIEGAIEEFAKGGPAMDLVQASELFDLELRGTPA